MTCNPEVEAQLAKNVLSKHIDNATNEILDSKIQRRCPIIGWVYVISRLDHLGDRYILLGTVNAHKSDAITDILKVFDLPIKGPERQSAWYKLKYGKVFGHYAYFRCHCVFLTPQAGDYFLRNKRFKVIDR